MSDFSDEDIAASEANPEWILAPIPWHVTTIQSAMRSAWGNPRGLKLRSIGVKEESMFLAEFGCKADMDRAMAGSPWVVGKYLVPLKEYDEKLSAAEIKFDRGYDFLIYPWVG